MTQDMGWYKQIQLHLCIFTIVFVDFQGNSICIPKGYSKFDLPNETQTVVNVGIDIKDIPKIDDKDFSVTLNAFFVVEWTDERLMIDKNQVGEFKGFKLLSHVCNWSWLWQYRKDQSDRK